MKHIFLTLAIYPALIAPMSHAQSFFDEAKQKIKAEFDKAKQTTETTWKKAKETVKSGYHKTSQKFSDLHNKALQGWQEISPETKSQIKKALIAAGAIAGTSVVAGVGYAAYSDKSNTQGAMGSFEDKDTFNELISFLSTDPAYKGDKSAQLQFLNRFEDIQYENKLNILDIVKYEENKLH